MKILYHKILFQMKRSVLFLAVAALALSVSAQSKLSNHTRMFLSDVKNDTAHQMLSTRMMSRSLSVESGVDMAPAFIHFYDEIDVALLESYGVIVEAEFPKTKVVSCRVPVDALESVSGNEAVRYVEMGMPVEQKMDNARALSNADLVHSGADLLGTPYFGKGVVVGIVDHGFQYDHAAFYDREHKELRVKRAWNMNRSGTPPEGYSRGVEYDTETEILNAKYDDRTDDNGHGCHVAGIAVGADHTNNNPYYGVAQESDVVMVSYYIYDQTNVDIANGVKYVFDYADEVGKPAVVNLSLGSHVGPHDGTSTFDRTMDEIVGPGKIVVGAAGNEGNDEFHLHNDFDAASQDTMMRTFIDVGKISMGGSFGTLDVWGDSVYSMRVVVWNTRSLSYGGEGYLFQSDVCNMEECKDSTVWITVNPKYTDEEGKTETVVNAKVGLSIEKNPYNDKYHCTGRFNVYTLPSYGVYIGVEVTGKNGTVHMWADNMYMTLTNNRVVGWDKPNAEYGVGEVGGTGKKMITVGSYNSNVDVAGYTEKVWCDKSTFSSTGPTADGRVKPDISAPGCVIVSSVPNTSAVTGSDGFKEVNVTEVDGKKNYYTYMQGTSMAAPYVTGTIATWLEANPELTYDEIMEAFENTAIRDGYYGNEMPNVKFGYGRINSYLGLLYVLGLSTSVNDVEMPASMMIYPNPTSGAFNVGFTRDDSNVTVMVYAMNGQLVYSRTLGSVVAGEDVQVALDNVDNGAYVVKVQGDAANETYRLLVTK